MKIRESTGLFKFCVYLRLRKEVDYKVASSMTFSERVCYYISTTHYFCGLK